MFQKAQVYCCSDRQGRTEGRFISSGFLMSVTAWCLSSAEALWSRRKGVLLNFVFFEHVLNVSRSPSILLLHAPSGLLSCSAASFVPYLRVYRGTNANFQGEDKMESCDKRGADVMATLMRRYSSQSHSYIFYTVSPSRWSPSLPIVSSPLSCHQIRCVQFSLGAIMMQPMPHL